MGHRGTPELELLAVVIVLFAPILLETLTNSNFDTNAFCQLSHGSSFKCRKLKSISQQKCFADCFTDWHNILNEDVRVTLCLGRSMLVTTVYGAPSAPQKGPATTLKLGTYALLWSFSHMSHKD